LWSQFADICGQIEDNMGAKKFKTAKDDIGIETDEDAGVSLNPPEGANAAAAATAAATAPPNKPNL